MAVKNRILGIEWSLENIWAEAFRSIPERPLIKRDRIYASELSGAYRDRYLNMYAHPFSNPVNFRSKSKMMAGRFFEDVVWVVLGGTGLLKQKQMRAMVELPGLLPVSGKMDFIAGGVIDWERAEHEAATIKRLFSFAKAETSEFVSHMIDTILPHFKNIFSYNPAMETIIEVKSLSGFVFNHVKKNNRPRRGHDYQALHYLLPNKDIPKAHLQYISREDCMLQNIVIERTPKLLKQYKEDVATMTAYHDLGKKNYLKHLPPPEPEVMFEEASYNFVKSNKVEYSKYLTHSYGYKNIDHFKERWDKILASWNRVFRRHVLEGSPTGKLGKPLTLTPDNIAAIKEAKKTFPDWDNLVEQARKAGAFDKPETETEED